MQDILSADQQVRAQGVRQTGGTPAAEIAVLAAPYEDIPRLDLAAVADAADDHKQAQATLNDHIYNRSDDGLPPLELPTRTAALVEQHGWQSREKRFS